MTEDLERVSPWRVLDERVVYEQRPWLRLREQDVELPNGTVINKYLLTDVREVAMIFAVTTEDEVLFVEQYKHGLGSSSLDLCAGYMDAEDPSPLATAQRELAEETGYTSDQWTHLGSLYFNPNWSNAQFHFFLARQCRPAGGQHLDPTEELRVRRIPLDEVDDLVGSGQVRTVSTVAGIALGLRFLRLLTHGRP